MAYGKCRLASLRADNATAPSWQAEFDFTCVSAKKVLLEVAPRGIVYLGGFQKRTYQRKDETLKVEWSPVKLLPGIYLIQWKLFRFDDVYLFEYDKVDTPELSLKKTLPIHGVSSQLVTTP